MNQQPRPAGVLARYLTVGGATVDVRYTKGVLHAVCGGEDCRWTVRVGTTTVSTDDAEQRDNKIREALPDAQGHARRHAETCRALPRPAVTR